MYIYDGSCLRHPDRPSAAETAENRLAIQSNPAFCILRIVQKILSLIDVQSLAYANLRTGGFPTLSFNALFARSKIVRNRTHKIMHFSLNVFWLNQDAAQIGFLQWKVVVTLTRALTGIATNTIIEFDQYASCSLHGHSFLLAASYSVNFSTLTKKPRIGAEPHPGSVPFRPSTKTFGLALSQPYPGRPSSLHACL